MNDIDKFYKKDAIGVGNFQGQNIVSFFYLDVQDLPYITTEYPLLFSGILLDFEKPVVGTEVVLFGTPYQVTRIIPNTNPGNPNVNTYYVKPLVKNRTQPTPFTPHSQQQFSDYC